MSGYNSRWILHLLITFLLWSITVSPVRAAERPERSADNGDFTTLDHYLEYALVHNSGLQAAYHRIRAAEMQVPQAETLPDPRFTYSYMPRSLETRVGPLRQKFAFSQILPWFGKRDLRGSIAGKQAHIESEKLRASVLSLFRDIKLLFYEYQYLARAVEVTRENIQLLHHLEATINSRYTTGQANYADTIKSRLALARLEDQLKTLETTRDPLTAKINALLNRPIQAPLPWPGPGGNNPLPFSDENALSRMVTNHPDLNVFHIQSTREDSRIELTRRDSRPDVTLGIEYSDMGGARMPDVPDSGKNAFGVSVSINLPIWKDGREAAIIQATRRKLQLDEERANREQLLRADLKWALFQYHEARRREQLYSDTLLPLAEQTMIAAEKAFVTAQGGFLDLLDAQRSLLSLQLEQHRIRADQAIDRARIEFLAGEEWSATVDRNWLGRIAETARQLTGTETVK